MPPSLSPCRPDFPSNDLDRLALDSALRQLPAVRVPTVRGLIDRRILVNFRIDADVLDASLPAAFRAKRLGRWAIGGICLIRLHAIRPTWLPLPVGLGSENAAHRFAVYAGDQECVYIPRRDTSSLANAAVGGRFFPGVHHRARFDVAEDDANYSVAMRSVDDETHVEVRGTIADQLPTGSVFSGVTDASAFFEAGSLGYSETRERGCFDGLELRTDHWSVTPLDVEYVRSSYFEDRARFPAGSVELDHALLMRGIPHEWHGRPSLKSA